MIWKRLSWHLPGRTEGNYENLRAVGVLPEIRTKCLPNMNQECCHYASLFGAATSCITDFELQDITHHCIHPFCPCLHGSLCSVKEPMGTGKLPCIPNSLLYSVSELMGTGKFSCSSYINLTFWQADCSVCYLLHVGFLLILFFSLENGGVLFLQNVS
jgi:hypothetical protein